MVWFDESIGHRIRHLRKARGLTERELGRLSDLSENAIVKIENDHIDIERHREYLERIETALGLTESLALNPAQRAMRKMLDALVISGSMSKDQARGVFGMAQPRLRSNPDTPLSRSEILIILETLRES